MKWLLVATILANSQPNLPASQEIAEAAWPNSPCKGRVTVGYDPVWAKQLNARAFAVIDGSCRVYLGDAMPKDPIEYCKIIVHEYGHLAGHIEHFDGGEGPEAVMDTYATGNYKPCELKLSSGFKCTTKKKSQKRKSPRRVKPGARKTSVSRQ